MTVTAPIFRAFVLDPVIFTITEVTGECTLNINGVNVLLSDYSGTITYNAQHLIKSLFTVDMFVDGTNAIAAIWNVTQDGIVVANGSFEVVYGTNKLLNLSSYSLRWLNRSGEWKTDDFCPYNEQFEIDNVETVRRYGINDKINIERKRAITLFIPNTTRDRYIELTGIQESPIVMLDDLVVEVVPQEYNVGNTSLSDFVVTIILPDYEG